MSRILIIEDETKVARFIQKGLLAEGFEPDVASTGDEGLRLASEHNYDVITVDLMLLGRNGLQSKLKSFDVTVLQYADTTFDLLSMRISRLLSFILFYEVNNKNCFSNTLSSSTACLFAAKARFNQTHYQG